MKEATAKKDFREPIMPDDLKSNHPSSEPRTSGLSLHADLESIIDHTPVGIVILDDNFQIVYNNPRASQILLHQDDLRGLSIEDLCKDDHDRNLLSSFLKSSLKASLPFTLRSPYVNDIHVRLTVLRSQKEYCLFVEDHSEILLLEQELQSFKTAIHAAGDAIFIFDENGLIFFTNPAFEQQVMIPQEQIIGQKIQYFWSENDSPSLHEDLWQCIQNARPWSGEMKWIRSDHSSYSVEMHMTPILTDEKQVVGFICVQRDITERKKIEKQLVDYSDNLERMVDERTEELANLHDITQLFHSAHTLDKRLRLLLISATANEVFRFNRAFLLLVDKSNENLIGRIAFGPSTPEEAGMLWERVNQIPRSKFLADTLQSYLQYAGEGEIQANQIAQKIGVPLDDSSSILTRAIHLRRAVVVKNGSAEVDFDPIILKQLGNDHFAVVPLLVENNPIGVLVVDNIITRRPIEEDDLQLLEILAAQAALAIAHADAMEQLAREVKETEAAYAELRASQEKLIEASKFAALGQMAATVAHEIRTPLVAIGGFVNLLIKKRKTDDPEYPHLKVVRDEAFRLEDVLNRLLFYARPSMPQLEVQLIEPLIESALSLLETEFKESGIEVKTEFSTQEPFPFDRNQIRQVIVNIIQNSFQSMEKGGRLYVGTREKNGEIIIEVRDTGEGISPENLPRIFEPFFSTKHAGTGLGMHVSQRIIQNHGGSIEVKSHLNQGAEVTIRLPRKQERADEKDSDHRR